MRRRSNFKNFRWTVIALGAGIIVVLLVSSEIGWHWTNLLPIPLGLIIGKGLDYQQEEC